jgi:putative transposase
VPNGVYHVTARGNRGERIFRKDDDSEQFLRTLADVVPRFGWRCHAYCLLPNHFHLVIETPHANLSAGMHRLNGRYAAWFNRRHAFEGHVFQRRFHAVLVESEWHLLELARYVTLNPVRAGLCDAPSQWRWSSYGATVGATAIPAFLDVDRVLAHFGSTRARAQRNLARFVADGLLQPRPGAWHRDVARLDTRTRLV